MIDRLALASAGLGPKSRVVPPAPIERAGRGAGRAPAPGADRRPVGGTLLITTRAEAPDRPGGPVPRPGSARGPGGDAARGRPPGAPTLPTASSRSTRWRGEATPKVPASGEADDDSAQAPRGWRIWRFAAPDWPGPDAVGPPGRRADRVRPGDGPSAWRSCWAASSAGASPHRPTPSGLAVLLASRPGRGDPGPGPRRSLAGRSAGALAVVFLWLGESIPADPRAREPRSLALFAATAQQRGDRPPCSCWSRSRSPRPSPRRADAGRARRASRRSSPCSPTTALPTPTAQPDRVVLRWRMSSGSARWPRASPRPAPVSASAPWPRPPRLLARRDRDVVVESEFELRADAGPDRPSPGTSRSRTCATSRRRSTIARSRSWSGREGGPASVLVPAGAGSGSGSAGSSRLRPAAWRRACSAWRSTPWPPPGSRSTMSPVGRTGRGPQRPGPDRARGPGASPGCSGPPIGSRSAGGRRGIERRAAPHAGDRRGTPPLGCRTGRRSRPGPPDLPQARRDLDPPAGPGARAGPPPRRAASGLVDATWEGTDEAPEWVASVDPPLPDGATIRARILARRPARPRLRPSPADGCDPLPRIEPLGVERYSGRAGVPEAGRVVGAARRRVAGFEPMTDEAFVKAWGNLLRRAPGRSPVRSGSSVAPRPSRETGPPAQHATGRARVQLAIESGPDRDGPEANLADVSGRSSPGRARVARQDLRLVAVEADGLTDWSRPASNRIRLRFDGHAAQATRRPDPGLDARPVRPVGDGATARRSPCPGRGGSRSSPVRGP